MCFIRLFGNLEKSHEITFVLEIKINLIFFSITLLNKSESK